MKEKRTHVQQAQGANPGAPIQPITPGLTPAERQARWKERMPWPANYRLEPRSRQTALGEAAVLCL